MDNETNNLAAVPPSINSSVWPPGSRLCCEACDRDRVRNVGYEPAPCRECSSEKTRGIGRGDRDEHSLTVTVTGFTSRATLPPAPLHHPTSNHLGVYRKTSANAPVKYLRIREDWDRPPAQVRPFPGDEMRETAGGDGAEGRRRRGSGEEGSGGGREKRVVEVGGEDGRRGGDGTERVAAVRQGNGEEGREWGPECQGRRVSAQCEGRASRPALRAARRLAVVSLCHPHPSPSPLTSARRPCNQQDNCTGSRTKGVHRFRFGLRWSLASTGPDRGHWRPHRCSQLTRPPV